MRITSNLLVSGLWLPGALLIAAPLLGEQKGLIQGRVTDASSGQPLGGANVEVLGTVLGTSTDSDGMYRVQSIPAGMYSLRVSVIGYKPEIVRPVTIAGGETIEVDVALIESPIALHPVVVTAEKRPLPLDESPSSVAVLTAAEIESRNSLRLDEALEMVPGVYFMKEDINIRGSTGYRQNSANRVLLTLDGVPVLSNDIGGINWDVLPIFDIDRVEVVKGAGSALWGSYAIGGVVNIITKDPSPKGVLHYRFTGGLYDDPSVPEWVWAPNRTLGYHRFDLGYSKTLGNFGMRLAFSRYVSSGDRQDGDFEKWNVSTKLSYRFADNSKLTFYFSWLRDESSFFLQWRSPFTPDSTEVSPPQLFHPLLPDEAGNQLRQNWVSSYLKYSHSLSAKSHLKVRVSYLRSILGDQFGVAGDFFPTNGFGGEIQLNWVPHPAHFVTVGSEFKLGFVDGVFFGGSHTEYAIAPFLQDEWQVFSILKLVAGFRFDRNELLDGPVDHQFNPKLGFNLRLGPGLNLRGSSGRGFRVPSIAERTINFDTGNFIVIPNPELKAESAWSHEIGVRKTFMNNWSIDAAVFQNDYRNFIEAQPDLSQTSTEIVVGFQNLTKAQIRGFEVSLNMSFWQDRFGLRGSMTHLDSKNPQLKQPLTYRPRWIAQINPYLRFGPVEMRADYRFASRLQRVQIYSLDQRVAQHELNLRLSFHLRYVDLTLGVNNALNYNYTQVERNLGEIRNFQFGVQGRL